MSRATVDRVWVGGRGRPRFLADDRPPLSWSVRAAEAGWVQASATVQVERDGETETYEVLGDRSQQVPWPSASLDPYATARARVAVRGRGANGRSPWSSWIEVETGPLAGDWVAPFVTAAEAPHDLGTIRLRTSVAVPHDLARAYLSVTAHGVYEAVVDGVAVGDEVLAPGWTAYDDVLTFQTYDVTAHLAPGGTAVVGATVARGWFGEHYGFSGDTRRRYEGPLALAAQLRLVDAAGAVHTLVTDESWEASVVGPVVSAGIYAGERDDARLEDRALAEAGAAMVGGGPAVRIPADLARLVPASVPPVREHEELPVREVLRSPSGATLLDFGQNLVGWLRVRAPGVDGHTITFRHAEVLDGGELGVRPLRAASATDAWTPADRGADGGAQEWSPRFTYHGFRYVEVTGWPGPFDADAVRAVVVHSDLVRTGELVTGDPLLDRLHENVVWSMRGNVMSLPTDCPQRDERLGWTGDIQVFAPTAAYLFDTSDFLGSWLRDLAAEQARNGGVVPFVVPDVMPGEPLPAAAWGDAATLVPRALWWAYGDETALRRQYPSMRRWVEVVRARAGDDHVWSGGFQFGDWLDPGAPPDQPAAARTDADLVATAYYARSAQALADAAVVLGHDDDAATYGTLAAQVRDAFVDAFVTAAGRMVSDAPTAYALAIAFGLVRGEAAERAGRRLAALVRRHGYLVGTGFVGTPVVLDALTSMGHHDAAYRLLQQEECPSWLYPVTMGATTVWERWDSMLPDGSINPGEMTSFNHYALGAVADWMHRVIGGIAPLEPGYRRVRIAPLPGGRVRRASASLDTGYGLIGVRWEWQDGELGLSAEIPVGVRACVRLPGWPADVEVGPGAHAWTTPLPKPVAAPVPVGLDSPMSVFADDDEARAVLLAACDEVGYAFAHTWSSRGRWRSDTTLRESIERFAGDPGVPVLARALHDLTAARTHRWP